MKISRLRLVHYRNYTDEMVEFGDGIQLICGKNAQGKTNLLEAIYYCSTMRSHRTLQDQHLIQKEEASFLIDLSLQRGRQKEQLRVCVNEKGKNLFIHRNPILRVSDFIGEVNAVLFCPDDLQLFTASPKVRRRFIDIEISKLSRRYTQTLAMFQRLLRERNALLKQKEPDLVYLQVVTERMCACEMVILQQRHAFLNELFVFCQPFYSHFAQDDTSIGFEYHTVLDLDHLQDEQLLKEKYEKGLVRDQMSGQTNLGVHKDDVIFTIEGKNINSYASQGQKRTLLLSMKLAITAMIKEKLGEYPILLLDDVFSELDAHRCRQLMEVLPQDMQIFISSAQPIEQEMLAGKVADVFEVTDGTIQRRVLDE